MKLQHSSDSSQTLFDREVDQESVSMGHLLFNVTDPLQI